MNAQTIWGAVALIAVAAITYLGTRYTARSSEQVAETTARSTVEADAYTKAMEIWKEALSQVKTELRELRDDLADTRAELDRAREEIRGLKEGRRAADAREASLEDRVRVLERILIEHNIEVPPWVEPGTTE
jgi:chromosome segregation ATPase